MIDHLLGRPSLQYRKYEVFTVLLFWATYLSRGHPHGPPLLRRLSRFFTHRLTAFQLTTLTLLYLYFARNFAKIFNLESPEPLANLYTRSYFRATWVFTALDAGFWTAMRIKRPWLRDLCSILFSGYYLFAAERADEKVRRVRATLTVEHLRVSWNKGVSSPYLRLAQFLLHPPKNKFAPRHLKISRPKESVYTEPVDAWLYFEGTREQLKHCKKLILDVPGGGYVAMSPRHHDDALLYWSRACPGTPILSIDYRKAPEFPYPYAVNEVYDVYHQLIATRGRCVGLSGDTTPRIALMGDSAGGNFAAAVTLMILNSTATTPTGHGTRALPAPDGLVLIYPSLDLSMTSWMTDEQLRLVRHGRPSPSTSTFLTRKSEQYTKAGGLPRTASTDSASSTTSDSSASETARLEKKKTKPYTTHLAVTSRLSYFNDRILTPEMMRAMVLLYIGPYHRPDFETDFLLSPIVAPEALLARFPKTYFLVGERDPLVDDTVIFAGRIRAAKKAVRKHRREMGLEEREEDQENMVQTTVVEGISHGFLMMASLFSGAEKEMKRVAGWLNEILPERKEEPEEQDEEEETCNTAHTTDDEAPLEIGGGLNGTARRRTRKRNGSGMSLASEVDLVGRRMKGLAGGLTAAAEEL